MLTCEIPPDLVDEVVTSAGVRERRSRLLPARVMVYFVLALCLFSGADSLCPPGYRAVLRELTRGLRGVGQYVLASSSALTQARRRLGDKVMVLLFERVRGPLAAPRTRWAHAFGLRLVAWDGTTVEVPDSATNAQRFDYHGYGRDTVAGDSRTRAADAVARSGRRPGASTGANPLIRLMMLVECGTHAVIDAVFDSAATASELVLANRLVSSLRPGMLLLADRNFAGYELWGQAQHAGADLLWRAKKNLVFFPVQQLPDGSFISVMPTPAESRRHGMARFRGKPIDSPPEGHRVRVVEYTVTITGEDGSVRTEAFRLITTLLDHRRAPAATLASLYAQRWEAETTYSKFKTRLRGTDMVLRSRSPEGVTQELYAFLVLYQVLCKLQATAANQGGVDPDRISFTITIRAARSYAAGATTALGATQQRQALGNFIDELLRESLPPRRDRHCPRQRRPPRNRYDSKRRDQPRPSTKVSYHIRITQPTRPAQRS